MRFRMDGVDDGLPKGDRRSAYEGLADGPSNGGANGVPVNGAAASSANANTDPAVLPATDATALEAAIAAVLEQKYGLRPRHARAHVRSAQGGSVPQAAGPNFLQRVGPDGTIQWDMVKVAAALAAAAFIAWKMGLFGKKKPKKERAE